MGQNEAASTRHDRVADAASAARAARGLSSWSVCSICIERFAACPGINLSLHENSEYSPAPQFSVSWDKIKRTAYEGCELCICLCNHIKASIQNPELAMQLIIDSLDWDSDSDMEVLDLLQPKAQAVTAKKDISVDLISEVLLTFDRMDDEVPLEIKVRLKFNSTVPEDHAAQFVPNLEFDMFQSPAQAFDSDGIKGRPINLDVGGDVAFTQICTWIERCRTSCENCVNNSSGHRLPGRVVDLDPPSPEPTSDLRLFQLSNSLPSPYVALSYCWGHPLQPQALTSNNLNGRINGFSSSDLPATIQDAIKVTRRLGFRFLWVDSLCIVQDSKADKIIEISKMKEIFEGAYLTIVAASAAKVTDGFLATRDPGPVASQQIENAPFWTSSGRVGQGLLQRRDIGPAPLDPVHFRAWTLEELLLSKRLLVYSSRTVSWQCHGFQNQDGGLQDEVWSLDVTLRDIWSRNRGKGSLACVLNEIVGLNFDSSLQMGAMDFKDHWESLLRKYTGRLLTDPRDRLIALDGIIKKVSDQLNLHCIAGIWQEHALYCLCWHYRSHTADHTEIVPPNIKSTIPETRSNATKYPTWSWASVPDPVCLPTELLGGIIGESDDPRDSLSVVLGFEEHDNDTDDSTTRLSITASVLETEDFELKTLAEVSLEQQGSPFFPAVEGKLRCTIATNESQNETNEYPLEVWPDTQEIWLASPATIRFVALRYFGSIIHGLILAPQTEETWRRIAYFEIGGGNDECSNDEDDYDDEDSEEDEEDEDDEQETSATSPNMEPSQATTLSLERLLSNMSTQPMVIV